MNFCFYSKYNGKSTIEQLRRVTFLFPPRHFILSIENTTGIPLYKDYMIPETSSHRTHYAMRPLYITIHTTDNTSKGADALSHAKLQYTGNVRSASWHYTVDNHCIYQ